MAVREAAKLGDYKFSSWRSEEAPFNLPSEHMATQVRAGLDGMEMWLTGIHCKPFTVNTITLALTYSEAVEIKHLYRQLVGTIALPLYFESEVVGYRFKVASEPDSKCERVVHGHYAGDNALYTAIVRTKWQLIAIPYTPPVQ